VTLLEVQTETQDGAVHVQLRGELDLSTIDKVESALTTVEEDSPATIVLDLTGLSFLDSTGLRTIVTADQRARRADRRLVVVKGPDTVHRVFTITRLDERLEMVDDLASA
jgi:anti-sigma B factor antagonist